MHSSRRPAGAPPLSLLSLTLLLLLLLLLLLSLLCRAAAPVSAYHTHGGSGTSAETGGRGRAASPEETFLSAHDSGRSRGESAGRGVRGLSVSPEEEVRVPRRSVHDSGGSEESVARGRRGLLTEEPEWKAFASRLLAAHREVEDVMHSLEREYNVSAWPGYFDGMDMSELSKDLFYAQQARHIIAAWAWDSRDRAADHDAEAREMVYVFQGTSVTAGQDNAYASAYPFVFNRTLEHIYRHLGIRMTVRNVALANNNCQPYDACIGTFGGDGIDIISYEHRLNCAQETEAGMATMLMQARAHGHKPLVIQTTRVTWKVTNAKDWINPVRAFKLDGLMTYETKGWQDPISKGAQMFTREWQLSDKVVAKPMRWHPGKGGHKQWGHALAYQIARMLEEVLRRVHSVAEELGRVPTREDLHIDHIEALYATPPDQNGQHPLLHCTYPETDKINHHLCEPGLVCHTGFTPKFRPDLDILYLVDGLPAGTDAEQIREDPKHFPGWPLPASTGSGGWRYQVNQQDIPFTAMYRSFGLKDEKWALVGNHLSGPLTLRIVTKREGAITVCQCQPKWGIYLPGFGVLQNATHPGLISVDDQPPHEINSKNERQLCLPLPTVPAGEHTLRIEVKAERFVTISHVVHF